LTANQETTMTHTTTLRSPDQAAQPDPLLAALAEARDRRDRADRDIRTLLAYARELTCPRPYRLTDLAAAAGMSISGVLVAYTARHVEQARQLLNRPAPSPLLPAATTGVQPMTPAHYAPPFTVNQRLTAKRRRRVVENDEYAQFLQRVIRAYSRRIGSGDIEAITGMIRLAADLDQAITHAVTGLRTCGYSWADIGLRLGITRQAAQQRWGTTTPGTSTGRDCA
jgi:hypothetical protein